MRRLVCLLSCAAVVMLAACSDPQASPPPEQEESVGATSESPEETAASSPDDAVETTSPTAADREDPGVPELPPDAMEDTEAGAEAFVQYYIDLINYTGKFPQPGLLDDLADPECGTCDNLEGVVTDLIATESHFDGDKAILTKVEALPSEGGYRVLMASDSPGYAVIDQGGQTTSRVNEGEQTEVVFKLLVDDGRFSVEWIRNVEN